MPLKMAGARREGFKCRSCTYENEPCSNEGGNRSPWLQGPLWATCLGRCKVDDPSPASSSSYVYVFYCRRTMRSRILGAFVLAPDSGIARDVINNGNPPRESWS